MDYLIAELGLAEALEKDARTAYARLSQFQLPVYLTDVDGFIIYYNPAAAAMWGRSPRLGVDRWCGSWDIYTVDGEFVPHDKCCMAEALRQNRPFRGIEAIAIRPDGTSYRFMPFPTPLRDSRGRLIGGVNLLVYLREEAVEAKIPQIEIASISY